MKFILNLVLLLLVGTISAQVIAVPSDMTRLEKIAAEELSLFLSQITGKAYPIVQETGNTNANGVIYLGWTEYARKHRIEFAAAGKEEWILKTVDGNLIVSGGRPAGTLYGVYTLLEKIGVYFLAPDHTVVPKLPGWRIPMLDETAKPAFAGRTIFDLYPFTMKAIKAPAGEYWKFRLRSRINGNPGEFPEALYQGDFFPGGGQVKEYHNFYQYVDPEIYFKSHPEYFSMNEQDERFCPRFGGQLCLSNPEVFGVALNSLRKFIAADRKNLPPDKWPSLYDFSQNDGGKSLCWCPVCREISRQEGGDSGLLIRFVNRLATEIAGEYPEMKIRTFCYSFTDSVPKITRPAKNVVLQYCDSYQSSDCYRPLNAENREKLACWQKAGACLMVWDYWNMGGKFFNPPRPEVMLDAIQPDLQFFLQNGVGGMFIEAEKDFVTPQNFIGLQFFLASQLMVNPEKNVEMLIDIYLNGYYGPTAPMMRTYLDNLRKGVKNQQTPQITFQMSRWNFLSPQFMLENHRILSLAQKMTEGQEVFQRRVQEETIPLYWTIVYYRHDHGKWMEKQGVKIDEIKTELYRNALAGISRYPAENPAFLRQRLEERFRLLTADLPCPERFAAKDPKHIFGYPHQINPGAKFQCKVVDDPNSPTSKTIEAAHSDPEKHGPKATSFGFYDYATKKIKSLKVDPADEEYHWYMIPRVEISSRCIFWGHYWYLQVDLSQAYILPDHGNDSVNIWDLWFRARFRGPAYIKDSTFPNSISVDMVVLVRPE